jgi:hypothetical protein
MKHDGIEDEFALHQVRERCHREWSMFKERMANAEKDYFQAAN